MCNSENLLANTAPHKMNESVNRLIAWDGANVVEATTVHPNVLISQIRMLLFTIWLWIILGTQPDTLQQNAGETNGKSLFFVRPFPFVYLYRNGTGVICIFPAHIRMWTHVVHPRVRPGNLARRHSHGFGFVTFERKSVSRQEKRRYFRKYRDLLLFRNNCAIIITQYFQFMVTKSCRPFINGIDVFKRPCGLNFLA